MFAHLLQHPFEHQPIQARSPAEALQPRQKTPGGDGLAVFVEQSRQHFVMQHQLRVLGGHYRLEIQLEAPLCQRLVEHLMPGVVIVADTGREAVFEAGPILLALTFGLCQRLITEAEHGLRRVTVSERRQADRRHGSYISGAGSVQTGQGAVEILRQLQRFFAHQPRRQHGKFAATDTGHQVLGFRILGALASQLLTDGLEHFIGALATETLVEAGQILDPQQQQITGAGLLGIAHPGVQLHLEVAPVGQPGQGVLIGLDSQFFAAFGLLLEQRLELLDHLVHRLHHTTQFGRARQLRQAQELAPGNGMGLLDHVVQWLELSTQQQRPQHGADRTADQQPAQATQCALPELGHGEHGMADHLDPGRLLPATTDQGIATGRLKANQLDEPTRHLTDLGRPAALDDGGVGLEVHHTDARVIATVEDRADHQLDHRRIVDIRCQRQRQRRGSVLRVGAQLIDVLRARALQADHEAATEGDHQEQTDSDQQLFEQRHLSACS
ncbi:hypothetical protein D3C85_689850 [compost metagenome]